MKTVMNIEQKSAAHCCRNTKENEMSVKQTSYYQSSPFPLLLFSLLVLVFSLTCGPNPVEQGDSPDSFTTYLDDRIPCLMERYDIPGVCLAVIHKGTPAWSAAYGWADSEEKRKMTVDALCRVESISKTVTAWGIMNLVEKGVLQLYAPISEYLEGWTLPESEYKEQDITIRHLLSNNAGMPLGPVGTKSEYDPQSQVPDVRDYLTEEARLISDPGLGFLYSNVGFNLLELIIEEATGQNFADYMADEILNPLGMHHSSFAWQSGMRQVIPTGYELQGKPVAPYVYAYKASGGLFATVDDIARFVCAGMTGRFYSADLLNKAAVRRLYEPEAKIPGLFGYVADFYGLGHFIEILPNGQKAVWHGGQGHGWMTHFHSVPKTGDGIVILTNSQRSWPFIARVLSDWAIWSGLGSVKMGVIKSAAVVAKIFIGLIVLVSVFLALRLAVDIFSGKRKFGPFSSQHKTARLFQALAGILIIGILWWCELQPYLFISSIFPNLIGRTGFSLLFLSIILIIMSLFPLSNHGNISGDIFNTFVNKLPFYLTKKNNDHA
jgi:CubicO group peptidase (beta-lactamase class C family)